MIVLDLQLRYARGKLTIVLEGAQSPVTPGYCPARPEPYMLKTHILNRISYIVQIFNKIIKSVSVTENFQSEI